jgi:hypothetical protein
MRREVDLLFRVASSIVMVHDGGSAEDALAMV